MLKCNCTNAVCRYNSYRNFQGTTSCVNFWSVSKCLRLFLLNWHFRRRFALLVLINLILAGVIFPQIATVTVRIEMLNKYKIMWITSRLVNTRFPSFLKHQQNCKRLLIWALVIHVWKALHFQELHSCLHYRENYYLCYHLCYVIHVGLIVKMFWFRRGLYRFFLKKSFLQKRICASTLPQISFAQMSRAL